MRYHPRMIKDGIDGVFIVGGGLGKKCIGINKDIEMLNLRTKQLELIPNPYSMLAPGLFTYNLELYTVGVSEEPQVLHSNQIITYDYFTNQWRVLGRRLPRTPKGTHSIQVSKQSVLVYDTMGHLKQTLIFDFKQFYEFSQPFKNCNCLLQYGPMCFSQQAFQFDNNYSLWDFDLKTSNWSTRKFKK